MYLRVCDGENKLALCQRQWCGALSSFDMFVVELMTVNRVVEVGERLPSRHVSSAASMFPVGAVSMKHCGRDLIGNKFPFPSKVFGNHQIVLK